MEEFDAVKNLWQVTADRTASQSPIKNGELEQVIKTRIKKERKGIAEYFWLSFTFQIMIYSFLCHLMIRFRGVTTILALCAVGVLLYIPFTVILMKRFKAMFRNMEQISDLGAGVKSQYQMLSRFFSFKKKFDIIAIPVNSVILTVSLFKLYVPGDIEAHVTGAILSCLGMIAVYGFAAWRENIKHFIKPLKRLDLILDDIEKNG